MGGQNAAISQRLHWFQLRAPLTSGVSRVETRNAMQHFASGASFRTGSSGSDRVGYGSAAITNKRRDQREALRHLSSVPRRASRGSSAAGGRETEQRDECGDSDRRDCGEQRRAGGTDAETTASGRAARGRRGIKYISPCAQRRGANSGKTRKCCRCRTREGNQDCKSAAAES